MIVDSNTTDADHTDADQTPFRLLDLPPELTTPIYEYVARDQGPYQVWMAYRKAGSDDENVMAKEVHPLLLTSPEVYKEFKAIFFGLAS